MRLKYIAFQKTSFTRENNCILFHNVQNKYIVFISFQYIQIKYIFYTPDVVNIPHFEESLTDYRFSREIEHIYVFI